MQHRSKNPLKIFNKAIFVGYKVGFGGGDGEYLYWLWGKFLHLMVSGPQ